MSRFVRPNTRTLTLENGDTLTVREQLTAGEQRAHFARVYTTAADGRLSVNPLMIGIGVIVAYLLEWSLRDDDGRPVVIRDLSPDDLARVIDSLDTESFSEIRTAIEAHEAAMQEARTEKKRTPGGDPAS